MMYISTDTAINATHSSALFTAANQQRDVTVISVVWLTTTWIRR